jgi:uncharacterized protein YjbI with pentapeptide repeats
LSGARLYSTELEGIDFDGAILNGAFMPDGSVHE